jgi:hypothetical protein
MVSPLIFPKLMMLPSRSVTGHFPPTRDTLDVF